MQFHTSASTGAAVSDRVDVLQFMMLRAPAAPAAGLARRNHIVDDVVTAEERRAEDLFSTASPSAIGKFVYDRVFCAVGSDNPANLALLLNGMLDALIDGLPNFQPACPNEAGGLDLGDLQNRTYFARSGIYYLLPDRFEDVTDVQPMQPTRLLAYLTEAAQLSDEDFDPVVLRKRVALLYGLTDENGDPVLWPVVFGENG